MKKLNFLSLCAFFFLAFSFYTAQAQFQRGIGGPGFDQAFSLVKTSDGGYAAAGTTRHFGAGDFDMYIVKLDAGGNLQWTRTIGETTRESALSIIQSTDGGYLVGGVIDSSGAGSSDMYIIKLDAYGALQWSEAVGGTGMEAARSVFQCADGGFVIAGYTSSFVSGNEEMFIVKLSEIGNFQWSKTVGMLASADFAFSVIQTSDGGYALAGRTDQGSYRSVYIVKLNSAGTLQWSKTIASTINDFASCIIQTADGGYAVAGQTRSFSIGGSFRDMFFLKFDASGTFEWNKTFGGTSDDFATSILQTPDGGYALAGQTYSFGAGGFDLYLVKLNAAGTLQWSKTYGGVSFDACNAVVLSYDGGYVMGGFTTSFGAGDFDIYIVKVDASGNTCGNSSSPSTISGTGGIPTNPPTIVASQAPIVTVFSTLVGTGGILTDICAINPCLSFSANAGNDTTIYYGYGNQNAVLTVSVSGGTPPYSYLWSTNETTQSITVMPTSTTTYTVTVTDSNECTASDTVVVNVIDVRCGNNNNKVLVCHNGHTICVSPNAVQSHLNHGDYLGTCGDKIVTQSTPDKFQLYNNYPNPFNPTTKIRFDIPLVVNGGIAVKLVVFDVTGREVATLINDKMNPGSYEVDWDASNYSSGLYFYKLNAGYFSETKKMVVIK